MPESPEFRVDRFMGTVLGSARIELDELNHDIVKSWRFRLELRRLRSRLRALEKTRRKGGIDVGELVLAELAPVLAKMVANPGTIALRAAAGTAERSDEPAEQATGARTVRIEHTADPSDAGGQVLRPHVAVTLHGLGGREVTITGLVDSGADRTCLPLEVATELGYEAADLQQIELTGLTGALPAVAPPSPIAASLVGQPAPHLLLTPIFVEALTYPIWGSSDFVRSFERVTFDDRAVTLVLRARPDLGA